MLSNRSIGNGLELVSGLKVKLKKSEIILISEVEDLDIWPYCLGVRLEVSLPSILGCLWEHIIKSFMVWDSIEKRFKRKLTPLKERVLEKRKED